MFNKMRCPLCNGEGALPKYKDFSLPVHSCICGMVFLHPRPALPELKDRYGEDYYKSWGISAGTEGAPALMKKATFAVRLNKLPPFIHAGKVLDIGCASGFFLEVARDAGWDVYGVELSDFAAALAQKKFGDRIFAGTLEDAKYPDSSFDLVTLSDLLEHVPVLDAFIKQVKRILKSGGHLMIVTPNVAGLSARIMGKHWIHYKTEHLYYFSPRTLRQLFERHGFEIVSIHAADKYFDVNYIIHQLQSYPNRILTPGSRMLAWILPKSLKSITFPFKIGEMIALLRRP